MIRIAVDGQTFASPDADRGIGVYLRSLLRHLHEAPESRFELMRWGTAPAGLLLPEDLPTFRLSDGGLADTGSGAIPITRAQARGLAVRRFVREHGADVLFNPNPLQPGVEPLARPGLVPLVATVHDLTPLVLPEMFLGPGHETFTAFYRQRLEHLTANADHLIADSESTRQDVIRLLGYPPDRVSVAHCGVDPGFRPDAGAAEDRVNFEALNRRMTEQYSGGSGDVTPGGYLLTVGGYNPKKNFENLFAAIGLLKRQEITGLVLLLAGPLDDNDWRKISSLRDRFCPDFPLRRAGYVNDGELAALYRHARLLAFPSLHEGFGLPVLEAMACGCPVLGGEAGSVPEIAAGAIQLCDPHSPASIAEGIERLLVSERHCEELRTKGLLRSRDFSWRKAAHDTAEALRLAVSRSGKNTSGPAVLSTQNSELRIRNSLLWYSPLPPDPGGVSAYSASMLHELADHFEITLVRDPALPPAAGLDRFPQISPSEAADAVADLRVYHMGNNLVQCADTYDALRARPGLTLVHDLNIHGFLIEHLVRSGPACRLKGAEVERHPYYLALEEAHGPAGAEQARQVLINGALPDINRFPCHRLLTTASTALVTHSRWGRDRLEANGDAAPVFTLPLGIEHPLNAPAGSGEKLRHVIGATEDDFVFACAGYLEPNRRLDSAILALAQLIEGGVSARLLLAGGVDASHKSWLESIAEEKGVADRITWRGYLGSDDDFLATLAAADAVVHLRHPTNGESSATILRALSMGRPVIVSATDSYRELPEDCCWKVDADRTEIPLLAAYLETLARRPDVRAAMSAAARRHIAMNHAWPVAAERFRRITSTVLQHVIK